MFRIQNQQQPQSKCSHTGKNYAEPRPRSWLCGYTVALVGSKCGSSTDCVEARELTLIRTGGPRNGSNCGPNDVTLWNVPHQQCRVNPQNVGTRHLERKHNDIQRQPLSRHPLKQESPVLGAMGLQMGTDARLCTYCMSSHLCVQGTAQCQSTRFPPIVQRASEPQPTWDQNPQNPATLAAAHTQPHFSMSTIMPQVCDCQRRDMIVQHKRRNHAASAQVCNCQGRDMVVQHTSKNHAASAQENSVATCQQAVGMMRQLA